MLPNRGESTEDVTWPTSLPSRRSFVAGGNGELLSRVLAANPNACGVLLERPHALAGAESTLAAVAERCTLVAGDFTESVPVAGDVYLLSRILHDWSDSRCHEILTRLAAAMPEHAELLVIERLLPADTGTESLAVPWDVHMLCNVGGRERSESHYRRLLAAAGFELTEIIGLPLDFHVLRAGKAEQDRGELTPVEARPRCGEAIDHLTETGETTADHHRV